MDQKDNSGALFRNEKKERDGQPDYTGKCVIDGKELRIAAWLNESKTGRKYFAMKFSEPRQAEAPAAVSQDLNDDIPF